MPRRLALVAVVVAAAIGILLAGNAGALTIYPIDRAEILLGSRFDVKVEFDGATLAMTVSLHDQKGDTLYRISLAPEGV